MNIPRLVIAGTGSGVGKTTVMVALTGALRKMGMKVATFKCGPDYLDPGWHQQASSQECHNLDGWMMGREAVTQTFQQVTEGADIALIEGVMGLFDGASPTSDAGSTAQIALWLDAPVILVLDAGGMARSVAAMAFGFDQWHPELRLAGIIANRVGSQRHLQLLKEACSLSVFGGLPKQKDKQFPERYLGLQSVRDGGVDQGTLDFWSAAAADWFEIEALLDCARSANALAHPPLSEANSESKKAGLAQCRIGIAYDEAFHFYYDYNLKLLKAAGAELIYFSPIKDTVLPEVDGLYIGGGYPELYGQQIAANNSILESIRRFAYEGGPIYGECGGLMFLTDGIAQDDHFYPMLGLIKGVAKVQKKLQALGYVEVETIANGPIGHAGLRFRGHQFRYSILDMPDEADHGFQIHRRRDRKSFAEGFRGQDSLGQSLPNVLGSWVHAHWASNDLPAKGFVESCIRFRQKSASNTRLASDPASIGIGT